MPFQQEKSSVPERCGKKSIYIHFVQNGKNMIGPKVYKTNLKKRDNCTLIKFNSLSTQKYETTLGPVNWGIVYFKWSHNLYPCNILDLTGFLEVSCSYNVVNNF